MERKEFIRIVTSAMEMIETDKEEFSCNALSISQIGVRNGLIEENASVRQDYSKVFCLYEYNGYPYLPTCFVCDEIDYPNKKDILNWRLNALAMYLAQSVAFKTYEGL